MLQASKRPIRVYRVRLDIVANAGQASRSGVADVAVKPSTAVLPFQDMSAEQNQGSFAEDVITGLSRNHAFFVIARNSSVTYKGSRRS